MGKLRQTRRAMTLAGHSVGHVTGKVEIMTCRNCKETVPVGTKTPPKCSALPQGACAPELDVQGVQTPDGEDL